MIIFFNVNFIIKDVAFTSYIIWTKYAIISAIIATIITISINCIIYKQDVAGVINIIKRNLKKKVS